MSHQEDPFASRVKFKLLNLHLAHYLLSLVCAQPYCTSSQGIIAASQPGDSTCVFLSAGNFLLNLPNFYLTFQINLGHLFSDFPD